MINDQTKFPGPFVLRMHRPVIIRPRTYKFLKDAKRWSLLYKRSHPFNIEDNPAFDALKRRQFEKRRFRAEEERRKWQELLQPSVLEILDLKDQRDLKMLQKKVQLQHTGLISIERCWNKLDEDVRVLLQKYDAEAADEIDNQSSETTSFLTCDPKKLEQRLGHRVEFSKRAIGKLLQAFDRECRGNGKWNTALKDKAAATLSEVFRCIVCMQQLREPRLCPQCSKLFCDACIKEWFERAMRKCPHCRAPLDEDKLVKCGWAEDLAKQLESLQHAVPRKAQQANDRSLYSRGCQSRGRVPYGNLCTLSQHECL